jgi:hypothetical protein
VNGQAGEAARRAQKFGKTPYVGKKLFSSPNPLKSHKTDKEMFGKAWRKQAKIWKSLAKKLGTARRGSTGRRA